MSGRRLRNVCFTSYREALGEFISDKLDLFRYIIYQQETCPNTGRLHWQGYAEFSGQKSFKQLKEIFGQDAHLEPREGSAQAAADYCRKDDTAVPGTRFEHGELSQHGKRNDLKQCYDMIVQGKKDDEILRAFPGTFIRYSKGLTAARNVSLCASVPSFRRLSVFVFYGSTGTGKTRGCYERDPQLYSLPLPANNALWFDGYSGEKTILLDDFTGWIKHSFLLRVLDGYRLQLPVKGGFISAAWTQVFITSNRHPRDWFAQLGLRPELVRRITECWRCEETAFYLETLSPSFGIAPVY